MKGCLTVVSDAHLDARTAGVERFDEIRESFEEAVKHAIDRRSANPSTPSLFVFCGDLCDSDDGRDVLRASAYAVDVAVRLMLSGIRSLWIAGNHDIVEDGQTTVLEPLKGLERGDGRLPRPIVASTEPVYFRLGWPPPPESMTTVLALPYSPTPYDAAAALREGPDLVFGHLMLPGMHPGSESAEFACGKDRMFPLEELRAMKRRPRLVVNGHYHRHQTTEDGIVIVGSLARLTFAETQGAPGYLSIDL